MISTTRLLEVEHLGRRHPHGQAWLLNDVNLHVESGARIVLSGPSGAGKTLLLRALARLDPVDEGTLRYQGQTVQHDAVPRYRSEVIYLHQRAALIGDSVEAALRMPYALKIRRQQHFDRERAIRLLAALGRAADFLDKQVAELSGGEIQIAALVRALQLGPSILLLDEPTAALDGAAAAAVEQLIAGWLDEDGRRAMIWVSHNEAQAARVGRTAYRMEGGRLSS
jgi:putative ABC transport system ATP-binding protein